MSRGDRSSGVAFITGASRRKGIGAAIALALAREGWDVAITFWRAYDERMRWVSDPADVPWLRNQLDALGVKATAIEAQPPGYGCPYLRRGRASRRTSHRTRPLPRRIGG